MGTISTQYKGDMLFETTLGSHTLTIDVPAGMGGKNRGPTPPDVFIASLGACVGAFVANYCNKADLDARDMTVDVSFDKAEEPTRLTNISVKITLPHTACENRERALRRVAEHCPVHETIATLEGIEFKIVDKPALERVPA